MRLCPVAFDGFLDREVRIAERRDLREVRDDDDLVELRKAVQRLPLR